jgi:hypothetical protein
MEALTFKDKIVLPLPRVRWNAENHRNLVILS